MKIRKVSVKNFRNLDGLSLSLHPNVNFVVGENNLGKSNFLYLLDAIFNSRKFKEEDFSSPDFPVEISIKLQLDDLEIGIFDDFFSPEDGKNFIELVAKQESPDDYIKFYHQASGEEISFPYVRCINFIKYDSLRKPKEELNFHRKIGVGKFLSYLVEKYLQQGCLNSSIIKAEVVDEIKSYLNNEISRKLSFFKDFGLSIELEEEIKELLSRLLVFKDSSGRNIYSAGYGLQFLLLIVFSLLDKVASVVENKRLRNCICSNSRGENFLSVIFAMDEPEIHLHPYMQRSLMKYLSTVFQNKENNFCKLLKKLFNIDKLIGQLIVVTHSPNILLDDYTRITRFFLEGGRIKTKSGVEVTLDENQKKHLQMQFPYIKEAFFSKCAVICEGETERGALPLWGSKILGDMDIYGVVVVPTEGKGGVSAVSAVLNEFGIPTVTVVDRDNGSQPKVLGRLIVTCKRDFEEELVEKILNKKRTSILFKMVKQYDDKGLKRTIQSGKLKKIAKRYSISQDWGDKDYSFIEVLRESLRNNKKVNLKKVLFLSWLDINKSITLGRFIGNFIEEEFIPNIYIKVFEEVKGVLNGISNSQ